MSIVVVKKHYKEYMICIHFYNSIFFKYWKSKFDQMIAENKKNKTVCPKLRTVADR